MNAIPHRNDLMKPTVEAIHALGGSGSVDEIVEKVISILAIPDELVAQPYITKRGNEDGRTQLEYELAWVRTYLKQLGILENSTRGVWVLTGKHLDSDSIEVKYAVEEATASVDWRERINKFLIETLSPDAFERLVQRMLRETGFSQVEVTGRTGDGGIDGKVSQKSMAFSALESSFNASVIVEQLALARFETFAEQCKDAPIKVFS